jgi:hypothetical protein
MGFAPTPTVDPWTRLNLVQLNLVHGTRVLVQGNVAQKGIWVVELL